MPDGKFDNIGFGVSGRGLRKMVDSHEDFFNQEPVSQRNGLTHHFAIQTIPLAIRIQFDPFSLAIGGRSSAA